jgi:hypothetical protein
MGWERERDMGRTEGNVGSGCHASVSGAGKLSATYIRTSSYIPIISPSSRIHIQTTRQNVRGHASAVNTFFTSDMMGDEAVKDREGN